MKFRMRGKIAQRYASDGELDTPFKRASAEWDHRMGRAVVQARNWRVAAAVAAMGWLGTSAGVVVLAQRPTAVRINTIDRDGMPVAQAQPVAAPEFKPTDQQVAHYLRQWLIDARRVSSDAGVTKAGWVRAHARTLGTATAEFLSYLKPLGKPDERSKRLVVTLDERKINIIPVTKSTYQADWRERVWKAYAGEPVESSYRGLHRIELKPPSADDPDNAIGFFVAEYHWHQVK